MDYEKAYKHALDLAKQVHDTTISKQQKENIEIIFPELAESEDEKIRKAIHIYLDWLDGRKDCAPRGEYSIRDMISWLGKQGENDSNKMPIWKHWKDGIAGNGEGEPIYLVKIGNTYSLNSCLGFECDYIELSELDNLMLEKQGEQKPCGQRKECLYCQFNYAGECKGSCAMKRSERKPTEWSEEDEKMLQGIWDEILANKHDAKEYELKTYDKFLNWLESLKERVQPQNNIVTDKELAQAKKEAYNEALDKIEYHSGEPTFDDGWNAAIWYLKKRNGRPKYTWKPSEELIEALEDEVRNNKTVFRKKALNELLEQLKKLK